MNELEKTRNVGACTRNLRLTAIRSFFRLAAYEMPIDRKLIDFMTRPEVDALLNAPDKCT